MERRIILEESQARQHMKLYPDLRSIPLVFQHLLIPEVLLGQCIYITAMLFVFLHD